MTRVSTTCVSGWVIGLFLGLGLRLLRLDAEDETADGDLLIGRNWHAFAARNFMTVD
jgi:hypothetical protein